ncbi:hypothetical protein [Streptomyces sp. NPDC050528]|uniref:hypothetical protein n=1 Tax=Streptomyces sp. NPDC050528 TaxID=3365623 RepID=UPI003799660A
MAAKTGDGRNSSDSAKSSSDAAQDLTLEYEECVTLAPDSKRFTSAFRQLHPRSIDEVREALGINSLGEQAKPIPACCLPSELGRTLITPAQLESDDPETRADARALAYTAARLYTQSLDPSSLLQWKPVLDRFIELTGAVINAAMLRDIEIADHATLTLSRTTHTLIARNIKIHGNGRLVCQGPVKIKAYSVEGLQPQKASSKVG